MSVQAPQMPSMGEHRNRVTHLDISNIDPRALLISAPYNHGSLMEDCQQQYQQQQQQQQQQQHQQQHQQQVFMGGPVGESMQRVLQHVASPLLPIQGLVLPNFTHVYQQPPPAAALECVPTAAPLGGARKKRKESVDRPASHAHPQQAHMQLGVDLNQALAGSLATVPHVGTLVSTGLRLAFDDERSTVTSSRPSSTCASSFLLGDELAVQFSTHQEDLNQLLKTQAEQLRQALEERTQAHAKALMGSVEVELSRRMREKEAEMERVTRRNAELEERVRQLSMEREVWQSKAKSNEAMVAILRSNLQQAMVQVQHQSREPSRVEGCGDSEADDAASVYIDDNPPAQQSRALLMRKTMMKTSHMSTNSETVPLARACRRCGSNEASVLLLPCLHLCMCLPCNQNNLVDRCPVCSSMVSNSAEVFLS